MTWQLVARVGIIYLIRVCFLNVLFILFILLNNKPISTKCILLIFGNNEKTFVCVDEGMCFCDRCSDQTLRSNLTKCYTHEDAISRSKLKPFQNGGQLKKFKNDMKYLNVYLFLKPIVSKEIW